MSLSTPTTKEINDNIIAQLEGVLNQTIPLLPRAFNRVLAKALSGVFVLIYKYAGFMFLQMFVRYASYSKTIVNGKTIRPLVEWGRLIGVGDPFEATHAELKITITISTQGGSLSAGTQLINEDTGIVYALKEDVLLSGESVETYVRAISDINGGDGSGTAGNLEFGDSLSFINAESYPDVYPEAVVLSQSVTAVEAESEAVYRQRVIDRFQKRPQGGAYADYEAWGREVPGVVAIYPYTSLTPGQVDIYVEVSGTADGFPTTAQLQSVYNSINVDSAGVANRRPANAIVNVYSIRRAAFDVQVTGLVVANYSQVVSQIFNAVSEYFLSLEPFISGLSILPRKDTVFELTVGSVILDIVNAAGGRVSGISVSLPNKTLPYTLGVGEKAKLRELSFVED